MPDGEKLAGKWASIAPMSVGVGGGVTNIVASSGLRSAWATAYGSGYSVRNVPGINRGEAMLVGTKGTSIQVEFFTGSGTASGTGVAKDNLGNTYKVLF
ncbi:MAG: hypothetical protein EON54_25805 [Alcaligenaceae bacterium]|nr:MAG: hypothetical protein EON54_25805 [Alcaligenaceae bacterium]